MQSCLVCHSQQPSTAHKTTHKQLLCGHVTCHECLKEWNRTTNHDERYILCPSGASDCKPTPTIHWIFQAIQLVCVVSQLALVLSAVCSMYAIEHKMESQYAQFVWGKLFLDQCCLGGTVVLYDALFLMVVFMTTTRNHGRQRIACQFLRFVWFNVFAVSLYDILRILVVSYQCYEYWYWCTRYLLPADHLFTICFGWILQIEWFLTLVFFVTHFLQHLATPQRTRESQDRLFLNAISNNDMRAVRYLIGNNVDVNAYDGLFLVVAAEKKNLELVRLLIDHGADVNRANDHPHTALTTALTKKPVDLDLIVFLVRKGANNKATVNCSRTTKQAIEIGKRLQHEDKMLALLAKEHECVHSVLSQLNNRRSDFSSLSSSSNLLIILFKEESIS